MSRDIYLVLVEYGQQRERAAIDLLTSTLQRVRPDARVRGVVVDNGPQVDGRSAGLLGPRAAALKGPPYECATTDVTRIAGDNTLHEFSGFDRGLAWLDDQFRPAPDALVVLANDTVAREDKRHRVADLPRDRVQAADAGALVGWIEEYPRPVELFTLAMRQFVDTSFVVGQRRLFAALTPFASAPEHDAVFSDDWRRLFREPSPLSENYRAYLRRYFFGERLQTEFDHDWHALQPLTAQNAAMFRSKLRCVFCEHLLSARARAVRIPLVDIRPIPLPIDPLDVLVTDR